MVMSEGARGGWVFERSKGVQRVLMGSWWFDGFDGPVGGRVVCDRLREVSELRTNREP